MPADATIVALRKGVTQALEKKQFSQQFKPEQKYLARRELEDTDQLHVTVMMAQWEMGLDNRAEWVNDYQLFIGIQYRAKANKGIEDTEKFDELMLLEQEITKHFHDVRETFSDAPLVDIALGPDGNGSPYIPEDIDKLNQFTAVVVLTFRKWS